MATFPPAAELGGATFTARPLAKRLPASPAPGSPVPLSTPGSSADGPVTWAAMGQTYPPRCQQGRGGAFTANFPGCAIHLGVVRNPHRGHEKL